MNQHMELKLDTAVCVGTDSMAPSPDFVRLRGTGSALRRNVSKLVSQIRYYSLIIGRLFFGVCVQV